MTIVMYDSIDLSQFPDNPEAVAGYVGGHWPTYQALLTEFPHAHHLSIAVTASQAARCLDVEPGDASPAQAPGWFENHADHSEGLPVLYGSASTVGQIIDTMATAGIHRGRYYVWSAHYTHYEHICSPTACGYPVADATQWTDRAMGRNLDQSLCSDAFFGATPAPTPPTEEEIVSVACGQSSDGAFHVVMEAKDGSLWETWQKQGQTAWSNGKPGVAPAGLTLLAQAPPPNK